MPREWTADQALVVVALLRQASAAVWEVHGETMAAVLSKDARYRDRLSDFVEFDEDWPTEDDIPF